MKFNVVSAMWDVASYRRILDKYNPEWSYDIVAPWYWDKSCSERENYEKALKTTAVITLVSLEDLTEMIEEIRNLNEGTDRWNHEGIIVRQEKDEEYPTITIYDGFE